MGRLKDGKAILSLAYSANICRSILTKCHIPFYLHLLNERRVALHETLTWAFGCRRNDVCIMTKLAFTFNEAAPWVNT